MIEKLIAKIVEQSLDELKFKNLAITVPLSNTKIDNIVKSLFGSNGIIIDFNVDVAAGDVAAKFTNAEDDGVVILKNLRGLESERLHFLTQILAERQLSLQLEGKSEPVKFPLPSFTVLALLETPTDISNDLSTYFNFTLDISSRELPEPLDLDDDELDLDDDELSIDASAQDNQMVDLEISSDEIYDWADDPDREPQFEVEIDLIQSIIRQGHYKKVYFESSCRDGIESSLSICISYINYLIRRCGHYSGVLEDAVSILTEKDGPYGQILHEVYNYVESEAISSSEFAEDDYYVPWDYLEKYFEPRTEFDRNVFLLRLFRCLIADRRNQGPVDRDELMELMDIPEGFENGAREILAEEFRNVSEILIENYDATSDAMSDFSDDDGRSQQHYLISTEVIQEWASEKRDPCLSEDIELIKSVAFSSGECEFDFEALRLIGTSQLCRAYLDYLNVALELNIDDDYQLEILADKAGVYQDILHEAYNYFDPEGMGGGLSREDYLTNEDIYLPANYLAGFFDGRPMNERLEFLYRELLLYGLGRLNYDTAQKGRDVNLSIPVDFHERWQRILSELFEKVCFKLASKS